MSFMPQVIKDITKFEPDGLSEIAFNSWKVDKDSGLLLVKDSKSDKKTKLRIVAPVSHGVRRTDNNAVYIPSKQKSAAKTYTFPYPKPVLIEHTTGGMFSNPVPPIGRVRAAQYVDSNLSFTNGVKPSSLSLVKSMDLIKEMMKNKSIYNRDFAGLGFVRADILITDQEAVEKFMDERYMTFSVGFSPRELFNPHTGKRIESMEDYEDAVSEKDGLSGFLVIGDKEYLELSVVSEPADSLAFPESLQLMQDSVNHSRREEMFIELMEDRKMTDGQEQKVVESAPIITPTQPEFRAEDYCGPQKTYPVVDKVTFVKALDDLAKDESLDQEKKDRVRVLIQKKADKLGLIEKPKTIKDQWQELSDFDLEDQLKEAFSYAKERGLKGEDSKLETEAVVLRAQNDLLSRERNQLQQALSDCLAVISCVESPASFQDFSAARDTAEKSENKLQRLGDLLKSESLQKNLKNILAGKAKDAAEKTIPDPTLKPGVARTDQDSGKLFDMIRRKALNLWDAGTESQAFAYLDQMCQSKYINRTELENIKKELK